LRWSTAQIPAATWSYLSLPHLLMWKGRHSLPIFSKPIILAKPIIYKNKKPLRKLKQKYHLVLKNYVNDRLYIERSLITVNDMLYRIGWIPWKKRTNGHCKPYRMPYFGKIEKLDYKTEIIAEIWYSHRKFWITYLKQREKSELVHKNQIRIEQSKNKLLQKTKISKILWIPLCLNLVTDKFSGWTRLWISTNRYPWTRSPLHRNYLQHRDPQQPQKATQCPSSVSVPSGLFQATRISIDLQQQKVNLCLRTFSSPQVHSKKKIFISKSESFLYSPFTISPSSKRSRPPDLHLGYPIRRISLHCITSS